MRTFSNCTRCLLQCRRAWCMLQPCPSDHVRPTEACFSNVHVSHQCSRQPDRSTAIGCNITELLHELPSALHSEVALTALCMRGGQHLQTPPCRRQSPHWCLLNVVSAKAAAKAEARAAKMKTRAFRGRVVLQAKAAAKAEAKAAKAEAKALRKAQEQRRLLEPGYEEQLARIVIPTTAGEVAFAPSELGSAAQEPSECLWVAAVKELFASMTTCAIVVACRQDLGLSAVQEPSDQ